jgi:large subunit ribosomal protein L3
MKALLGKKLGMTQIFDEDGNVQRITVIEAGPCVVTQVKTRQTDGYNAVQIGFGAAKKVARPQMGHFKAANVSPAVVKEVRVADLQPDDSAEVAEGEVKDLELKVGAKLDVSLFEVGDKVQVTGTSKGKGFAGTIKRHNFSRGPKTHGSHNYRAPGSIGAGYPQHVFKGIRMAGQMGAKQHSVRGLTVVLVDPEKNLIGIRGAVPGAKRSNVLIKAQS